MKKFYFTGLCLIIGQLIIAQAKVNIPGFSVTNPESTFVIAIGNEDYQTYSDKYTENVLHAIYEAELFCQIMEKEYGIPKFNISFHPDAISPKMKLAFTKVSTLANKYGAKAQIIVYYTGRYENDKNGLESYLIPTDQAQSSINQGIGFNYIYQKLSLAKTNNIWILIDACVSGKDRDESLLANGGMPFEIKNSQFQGKFKIIAANETDKIRYDQTTDNPVGKQPKIQEEVNDNTPPQITITGPDAIENIKIINERTLLLTGTVSDESGIYAVAVNGKDAHLQTDGSFQARVTLTEGQNKILVEAIDTRDNYAQQKLVIEYVPTKETVKERPLEQNTEQAGNFDTEGKYYALIIGISDYQDPGISDLGEPVNDAQKLYNILISQYTFESNSTVFLKNPSREDVIAALDQFERVITPNDNVLIFYAGHGYWDKKVHKGYWFPSDAKRENTANWVRNTTITGYISGINSKHTLIVADACFGGSIFLTRGSFDENPPSADDQYTSPSRKAMTSGNLEEVPDRSVFLHYLCKKLSENNEKFITAEELFLSCKPDILNNCSIIPQYGEIKNSGDEGGAFVFIKK